MKRTKKTKPSKLRKTLPWIAGAVLLCAGVLFFTARNILIIPFSQKAFTVYIRDTTSLEGLLDTLSAKGVTTGKTQLFRQMARRAGYRPEERPGAYRIDDTSSLLNVFRHLKNGMQTPVRFTFNNLRTKEQLAQRAGASLMLDADSLAALLADTTATARYGFTPETAPALFIPDTYELYWTVTPDQFLKRMRQEYDRYWTDARRQKAEKAGLTPVEVATLASIVEEETLFRDEMRDVAGLYLNRLRRGMPLQADPTVKFAVQDFELRRILHEHLQSDSPYNTYRYAGLPPGPIRIASQTALDAVLNYSSNDFLYMCAKEDFSGRHNFARTLDEHVRNAQRYRRALTERKIFR